MDANGVKPVYVYNHLIATCAGRSKWGDLLAFYEDMISNEILPDDITCAPVLQAYMEMLETDAAGRFMVNITTRGMQFPEDLLNATIRAIGTVHLHKMKQALDSWDLTVSKNDTGNEYLISSLIDKGEYRAKILESIQQRLELEKTKPTLTPNNLALVGLEGKGDDENHPGKKIRPIMVINPRENPNPEIHYDQGKEFDWGEDVQGLHGRFVYNLIRNITDPEHPLTLEQLRVVRPEHVNVWQDAFGTRRVHIQVTPTVPHCSVASLIGLTVLYRLESSLPSDVKVCVQLAPNSHDQEEAVNKQLADAERTRAALENPALENLILESLSSYNRE
ncbi:hypothetical protein AAMO2058_000307100 [Amorphochlora amoebiformis]